MKINVVTCQWLSTLQHGFKGFKPWRISSGKLVYLSRSMHRCFHFTWQGISNCRFIFLLKHVHFQPSWALMDAHWPNNYLETPVVFFLYCLPDGVSFALDVKERHSSSIDEEMAFGSSKRTILHYETNQVSRVSCFVRRKFCVAESACSVAPPLDLKQPTVGVLSLLSIQGHWLSWELGATQIHRWFNLSITADTSQVSKLPLGKAIRWHTSDPILTYRISFLDQSLSLIGLGSFFNKTRPKTPYEWKYSFKTS